jgi:hypothetical protein
MNAVGYWNNGVLEYWVGWNEICFHRVGRYQKNKIRPISVFGPQYYIIPSFHYYMGYLTAKTTPLSEL